MTSGEINVYGDLKLLKDLFLTFDVNNIDDQCYEYEAEQVHEIVERMLTVLEQQDSVLHIFGKVIDELDWEFDYNGVQG